MAFIRKKIFRLWYPKLLESSLIENFTFAKQLGEIQIWLLPSLVSEVNFLVVNIKDQLDKVSKSHQFFVKFVKK